MVICSKRVTKKKAPAGVRAAKLAKAKKTSVPRKVVRRETRSARKRRREAEGDTAVEESPRKRRREEGDAEEGFEALSEGELDLEELAGDPTATETENEAAVAGPSTPRQAAIGTAKMCAADKVRYTKIIGLKS